MLFFWGAQDELRRGQLRQITVVDVPPLISQMSLVMKRLPYVPLALNAFINSVKAMSWDSLTPVT